MAAPIITPQLLADAARRREVADSLAPPPDVGRSLTGMNGLAAVPNVAMPAPTAVSSQPVANREELDRLKSTGSGISQIQNPWLRGVARVADAAGSILAPRIEQQVGGTEGHHQMLLARQEGIVGNDQANQKAEDQAAESAAQTARDNALADYTLQRPEIEKSKLDQKTQAAREKYTAALRQRGIDVTGFDDETGLPITQDNPEVQAFQTAAATALLHEANAEKARIEAEIKQNGYMPGTPEYERAMKQIAQKDAQIALAGGNLNVRRAEFGAHAYGVGPDGQELPGALHDEEGNTVGTWNANNVKPTTQERDAAGRADSMVEIGNRIRAALKDPEIQAYLGPVRGRMSDTQGNAGMLPEKVAKFRNDLISYGAFQAGLHPVRGIGALQYFDRVMGGLGQTPESLLGKLNSNEETAGDVQKVGKMPTKASASNPHENAPKAGEIVDGYKFKGGNPADQKNWEKQ